MAFVIRLISFFLIFHNVEGQFGEIASIVTGLLGAGGGAGGLGSLGSLAGSAGSAGALSGLAGSAGSAASAGGAAANALGSFGQLYQMAQAALQLTGTGVGIVNQASESAWFPAALENVARTNREFQDRLLAGQGSGSRKEGEKTKSGMAGLGGLPDLFPGLPKLGVGGSEIGTEFGKELSSKEETGSATTDETPTDLKPISTKGEEEIVDTKDLDPNIPLGTGKSQPLFPGQRTLLPGEVGPGEGNKEEVPDSGLSDLSPTITVQLPKSNRKPQLEFSTDSNEETFPLLPPRAISPNEESIVDVHGDKLSIPQMVPELKKLLTALKKSNLTADELLELTKQLEGNGEVGAPRENTTPEPKESEKTQKPKTQAEQAAIDRNILALRRALSSTTLTRNSIKKFAENQANPPVVITLPKVTVSSTTDVKLPIQKRLNEALEVVASTSTPAPSSRSPLTTLSGDKNGVIGVKRVREFMVDGVSSGLNQRGNTETSKRTRTARPATTIQLTTISPSQPTTISYNEYYRQYYQQYYAQNPQAQIYNYYAQNPFGQLFQNQNAQQFGQTNVVMQRPVAQQQYYNTYNGQYNQNQIPQQQFYQQQSQPNPQANYYSTAQQQTQSPRIYPVRLITNPVLTTPPSKLQHPLSQGSLLTLAQPKDFAGK